MPKYITNILVPVCVPLIIFVGIMTRDSKAQNKLPQKPPVSEQTALTAAVQNKTIIPSDEGSLIKCWTNPTEEIAELAAASDNEQVFYFTTAGKLAAIEIRNGNLIWQTEIGGRISSKIYSNDGMIYLATETNNENSTENNIEAGTLRPKQIKIRALDAATGLIRWEKKITGTSAGFFFIDQYLFTVNDAETSESIARIDPTNGTNLWKTTATDKTNKSEILFAVPFDSQHFSVITSARELLIMAYADGKISNRFKLSFLPQIVAAGNGKMFLGDDKGNIEAFDTMRGKKIWKLKTGGQISQMVITERGLLAASLDNFLYLLTDTGGRTIWKRRLGSRAIFKPLVNKNMIYTTARFSSSLNLLSLDKGALIYSIPLDEEASVIADPVAAGDFLLLPTDGNLEAFSRTGCPSLPDTE